jgi:hypothetical protein
MRTDDANETRQQQQFRDSNERQTSEVFSNAMNVRRHGEKEVNEEDRIDGSDNSSSSPKPNSHSATTKQSKRKRESVSGGMCDVTHNGHVNSNNASFDRSESENRLQLDRIESEKEAEETSLSLPSTTDQSNPSKRRCNERDEDSSNSDNISSNSKSTSSNFANSFSCARNNNNDGFQRQPRATAMRSDIDGSESTPVGGTIGQVLAHLGNVFGSEMNVESSNVARITGVNSNNNNNNNNNNNTSSSSNSNNVPNRPSNFVRLPSNPESPLFPFTVLPQQQALFGALPNPGEMFAAHDLGVNNANHQQ